MGNYSVDSCELCVSEAAAGPRCSECGRRVASRHLVVRVRERDQEERYSSGRPIYPSGNPATGPTYWEPYTAVTHYTFYELTYADGHQDRSNSEKRVPNQCDHCHLLGKVIASTDTQLASMSYPEAWIPGVRWGEVLRHGCIWAILSVIPLGFALAGIRSFTLLFIGMTLAGIGGGARSYAQQIAPIERAREGLQKRVERHEAERDRLKRKAQDLADLSNSNRNGLRSGR